MTILPNRRWSFLMLNKDIQQIRIGVVETLLEACKDDPNAMYEQAQAYLTQLQNSLQQNKEFYEQGYRG